MNESIDFTYAIADAIIKSHEDAVLAKVEKLYPDEGERIIIEMILIPQFRIALKKVLTNFEKGRKDKGAIRPRELENLCKAVDEMLREKEKLLDTEGLFKSIMEEVRTGRAKVFKEMRDEFKKEMKSALAVNGITNWESLMKVGTENFRKLKFPGYGSTGGANGFIGAILGRRIGNISKCILEEMAMVLGWEKPTETKEH